MTEIANPIPQHETIEEIPRVQNAHSKWSPIVGQETLDLLDRLEKIPIDAKAIIRDEAIAVLSQCIPPSSPDVTETGLVIGYIQSGKTMSFTTVAALARDNKYQMIIVITGISMPLFIQSKSRLQTDLHLNVRQDHKWQFFENPSLQKRHHNAIQNALGDWGDPSVPTSARQTVLITVMKHHGHLRNLAEVLSRLNIHRVPTLIIDDEADQAGLNTRVRQGDQSTTYQRLLSIRNCIPLHTFLQYTATPQAPLLINIIDVLSPNFTELLTPGSEYVGGREFFLEHPELIRIIPTDEIPGRDHRLNEPPDSLFNAMKIFFLGVAAGFVLDEGKGNRSMLVHPSQQTMRHRQYYHWVIQHKELWKKVLELDEQNADRRDLLADFQDEYQDLYSTVPELPPFEILATRLLHAVRGTRVEEVNAATGPTPQIVWNSAYPWILVGGQAMDRGFTVEGLTISYMPRGAGVSNADTVQQRARFFGYKRRFLGYCRIFLQDAVRDAYRSYVTHEEDIRNRLLQHRNTGKPLGEWKRAFFLDQALRPTRNNVLDLDPMRGNFSNNWYSMTAPHDSAEAIGTNREVVDRFVAQLQWRHNPGHPERSTDQKHLVTHTTLSFAFNELLTRIRVTRIDDSQRFTGLLIQIQRYLEQNGDRQCTIYQMKSGATRYRRINDNGEIGQLFSGADPVEPKSRRGEIYPGDREIRDPDGVTIQIHNLDIGRGGGRGRELIADNVPTVAVWLGARMADWLVQNQGRS